MDYVQLVAGTACIGKVFIEQMIIAYGVERHHNEPPPGTGVNGPHLGQMVGVQHQSMAGGCAPVSSPPHRSSLTISCNSTNRVGVEVVAVNSLKYL